MSPHSIIQSSKRACATRLLKNINYLRNVAPDILPETEPLEGFSIIPYEVLANLHTDGEKISVGLNAKIAERLKRIEFPRLSYAPAGTLFKNTLYFVQLECTIVDENGTIISVTSISDADMATLVQYATLAAFPISSYATQYGKNSITVCQDVLKYKATVPLISRYGTDGGYDFNTLQAWVEQVRSDNRLPSGACVIVLDPPGVQNTWASQNNVRGYHWATKTGPYIYSGAFNKDWTVDDPKNNYAMVLSHEMAEVVVDPAANFTAPEVCDPCTNVCGDNTFASFFDDNSEYIATLPLWADAPPKVNFAYRFYISAIAMPGFAAVPGTDCPSDQNQACNYGPPREISFSSNRHQVDAAWFVRLWLLIHGPDPTPDTRYAREILNKDSDRLSTVRAIAALARCLNDAQAEKSILGALQPLAEQVGAKVHEES